jgi:hypothetical protein
MENTSGLVAKKGVCDMQLDQLKERQRVAWETGDYSQIGTILQIVSEALTGLDHGIGHLASMSPQNNEQLPPLQG